MCVHLKNLPYKRVLTHNFNISSSKLVWIRKFIFKHAIYLFFVVCDEKDIVCKRDNISLEAVYEIHHLIDDDQNGNVDQSESDEVSVQSYQTRSVNLTLM